MGGLTVIEFALALSLTAQITWFDVADIACWRRLLADLRCGQRQPVELLSPTFLGPGVRQELAGVGNDPNEPHP